MSYEEEVATAQELIAEAGRDVILLNKQLGTFNPNTNTVDDSVDTLRTVKAVFTLYQDKEVDGTIIQRGDKRCLVAGAINPGETVIKDGARQYQIVDVQAVQPGETVILSKLQVRR